MKKVLLFASAFSSLALAAVISSSCSNAVEYHISFLGSHLKFNGKTDYAGGLLAIGNISAEKGYEIPDNISIKGVDKYTYNPKNGDVMFTINQNVTITAEACHSLKFYGNACTATGEGHTDESVFEIRYPYYQTSSFKFQLTAEDPYLLPPDVEVNFDGMPGEKGYDYTYDTVTKTLEILSVSPFYASYIEVHANADTTFPVIYNFEHCRAVGSKNRYRNEEFVDFKIQPDEGYDLPEAINVTGVDGGNYVYSVDNNGVATFYIREGGMPSNRVTIDCVATIRSYGVALMNDTGSHYQLTSATGDPEIIDYGAELDRKIESIDGTSLPDEIAISNDDTFLDKNQYTYDKETGEIHIDEGVVTGAINIFVDLGVLETKFPFAVTSGFGDASGNEGEYSYHSAAEFKFEFSKTSPYQLPITKYEVSNLNYGIDYEFNTTDGTFTLKSMPAAPVNLKVLGATPKLYDFTATCSNCHFVNNPKNQYAYGSEITLQVVPDSISHEIPHSLIVKGLKSNEYNYDSSTGILFIPHMPAKNVSILAESYKPEELINIDEEYRIVCDFSRRTDYNNALQINEAIEYYLGYTLEIVDGATTQPTKKEIIFNSDYRQLSFDLKNNIYLENYCRMKSDDEAIAIVGRGVFEEEFWPTVNSLPSMCAVDRFCTDYINENGVKFPKNKKVSDIECYRKEQVNLKEFEVKAKAEHGNELRDPFIVEQPKNDGTNRYDYYLYGTIEGGKNNWQVFKCENQISENSKDWVNLGECCENYDERIDDSRWAPEVYEYTYQGKKDYYMFTTYRDYNDRKGVTVMKSSSLDPTKDKFKIASYDNNNEMGFVSPRTEDERWYIDGSLYVDENQKPWITLVDNFRRTPDGDGRMAVAMLSDDLTHLVSTPTEIFNARDVNWVGPFDGDSRITDGPFVYRTKSGKLLMQWSSYTAESTGVDPDNFYGVGFATSENGSMLGDWQQHDRLLYERGMYKGYTGGHGHFFFDHSINQMYLCLHSPNSQDETEYENEEHPLLIPVKEAYGTIVWDIYQR